MQNLMIKIVLTLKRNLIFTLPLVTVLLSVWVMSLLLSVLLSRGIWSQVPLLADEPSYLAQQTNPEEKEALQLFERAKDKVAAAKLPDTTVERQITLYQESLSILDRLIVEYASTDLAYKLSRGEYVGGIVIPRLESEIEVLQAFTKVRDKVEAARRNRELEEQLALFKEGLAMLTPLLSDYSSTDLVEKLKRYESVADIQITELEEEIKITEKAIIDRDALLKFNEGRAKIVAVQPDTPAEKKLELYKEGLEILESMRETYRTADVVTKLERGECVESICLEKIEKTLEVWLEKTAKDEFTKVHGKWHGVKDIDTSSAKGHELEKKREVFEEVLKELSVLMEKYPSTRLVQDLRAGKKIRGIRESEIEQELQRLSVEDVSICVLESVGCVTFKVKRSEKEKFAKIQRLLQIAKQTDSPQEKIRSYQAVLTELSPLSDKTAVESVKNILNTEVEVSALLTEVRKKLASAREESSIAEKRRFYKEALDILDRIIKDYPRSVQLIQVSTQRSATQKEYHDIDPIIDEQAALKELIKVHPLLLQARRANSSEEKIKLYEAALTKVESIITTYPSTELVRKLIRDQEVEGIKISAIEKALKSLKTKTPIIIDPDDELPVEDIVDRNVKNFKLVRTLTGHSGSVFSVSYSPDGTKLASGSRDNTIRLWDVATGQPIRILTGHRDWVNSVSFSPDGTQLASGSSDDTIRLWYVATGRPIRALRGHRSKVVSVSFSPDGTQLASVGGREIRLWRISTGREIRILRGHSGDVESVSFSPDGKQLASVGKGIWNSSTRQYEQNEIRLWDVATGLQIRKLEGHGGAVYSLSYSPDGRQLALGSSDKTIRLWDVATGRQIRTITGHSGDVESVSFSPDGKQLASGSSDKTIRLWDVATGRQIRTITGHSSGVLSVSYDGKQIASGSEDNTIKIWE